jgi:polyhydroxyalkanoate synthesis regulator phasin
MAGGKSLLDIIIRQKRQGKGAKETEKEIGSLKKGLGNLEKAALGAGVAMVGAFAAISLKSIQLAGDMEEMESKFEAVFKETAPEARQELEAFAQEVNRSRFELMEMASSLQDTFVPLGFARDKAKDLSLQLTKLAVDVASFNNAQEPEVMAAFQSAIVGNHEAVRSYGIVITQASLNQELLNIGFEGGVQKAGAQEKALARLNIILGATSDAQGDAVKTADSFVNSMKGLKAQIEELQVSWGRTLLPLARDTVKWLSADAEAWIEVDRRVQDGTSGINDNIISRYTLFRRIRDDIIAQRELEESWRAIDQATAGADQKFRNLIPTLDEAGDALEEVGDKAGGTTDDIKEIASSVGLLASSIDTNLSGSVGRFLDQLAFFAAGGLTLQETFGSVQEALAEGRITPEQARDFAAELFIATQDLQTDLGNLTAEEAARNIQEQLGGSLQDAKQRLDAIDEGLMSLPARIEIEIAYTITGDPIPDYQHGGQFRLPGPSSQAVPVAFMGHGNETVTVTPSGASAPSAPNFGPIHITVEGGSGGRAIADEIVEELGRRVRIASSSGAGFAGM